MGLSRVGVATLLGTIQEDSSQSGLSSVKFSGNTLFVVLRRAYPAAEAPGTLNTEN